MIDFVVVMLWNPQAQLNVQGFFVFLFFFWGGGGGGGGNV